MRMYDAGEWSNGAHQEELRSPYSGDVIDTVPVGTADDVDQAIEAAVRGAARQRRTTGHEREAILRRAGDIADTRVEELARTISAESGKAIAEARGEASRAGDLLRLSAFEGSQLYGDSLPLDAGAGARPASSRISTSMSAVRGVCRAGLSTTALPAASAGAILCSTSSSG